MTNFDCDKVIILYYAIGAGGRFLANNLSLSPDCVMMNSKLAKMQLDGELTPKQKLTALLKGVENADSTKTWNDLSFRDTKWFGLDYDTMPEKLGVVDYFYLPEFELKTKVYTNEYFKYLTINNTKYLFITSHSTSELNKLSSVWKNAKILSFKNENLFCRIRNHLNNSQLKYKVIWSLIPEEEKVGWIDPPYYHREFLNCPRDIQTTVLKYLKDPDFVNKVKEILDLKYSVPVPKSYTEYNNLGKEEKRILESENTTEEYTHPDSVFVWDCNWYLSEQNTIHNTKCLYDVLELEGYDEQSTRSYYRSWIEKLEELS